jgi:hypothetical protein
MVLEFFFFGRNQLVSDEFLHNDDSLVLFPNARVISGQQLLLILLLLQHINALIDGKMKRKKG